MDEAKRLTLPEFYTLVAGKLFHAPNTQEEVEESESASDFAASFARSSRDEDDD